MDVNLVRSVVTVVMLLVFLGIVAWAWSRSQRGDFAESATLPFAGDAPAAAPRAPAATQPRTGATT